MLVIHPFGIFLSSPLFISCTDTNEQQQLIMFFFSFFAEVSYLRRAIIDGKYNDAAHYLDVQFRLFREDLISPLRDGIAVYKRNGNIFLNFICLFKCIRVAP